MDRKNWKMTIPLMMIVSAVVILMIGIMSPVMAEAENSSSQYVVHNAEELNEALGGDHQINGQTVYLNQDVVLNQDIVVLGTVTINMNGKEITTNDHCIYVGRDYINEHKNNNKVMPAVILDGTGKITGKSSRDVLNVQRYWRHKEKIYGTLDIKGAIIITGDITAAGKVIFDNKDFDLSGTVYADAERIDLRNGTIRGSLFGSGPFFISGGVVKGGIGGGVDSETAEAIITGGELHGSFHLWNLTMYDGVIYNDNSEKDNITVNNHFVLSGGVIRGSIFAFTMKMTGGSIIASRNVDYAILINDWNYDNYSPAAVPIDENRISGGKIFVTRENGDGIVDKSGSLMITGGTIIHQTNQGGSAVRVLKGDGRNASIGSSGRSEYQQGTFILKAKKGKRLTVSGFRNSIEDRSKLRTRIGKHTVVKKTSGQSRKWKTGMKLPKVIRGNITMRYMAS